MEDLQIVRLFFERDERAIGETEIKYARLCRTIALNVLGNAEEAEECVNDTYLSLWNTIPPAEPDNFKAYVCRITRNLALNRLAYNSAQKRSSAALVPLSELEDALSAKTLSEDDGRELGRLIVSFLRTQKADARNIFIRRYWYLDTVAGIAAKYSFSESKVKSMLYRTRCKLGKYLKKEGFEI